MKNKTFSRMNNGIIWVDEGLASPTLFFFFIPSPTQKKGTYRRVSLTNLIRPCAIVISI